MKIPFREIKRIIDYLYEDEKRDGGNKTFCLGAFLGLDVS